jgi:hypothetical protein
MRNRMESRLPDADMQAAPRALLRAAHRAREIARRAKTGIVVMRDGQVIEESVDESRES